MKAKEKAIESLEDKGFALWQIPLIEKAIDIALEEQAKKIFQDIESNFPNMELGHNIWGNKKWEQLKQKYITNKEVRER